MIGALLVALQLASATPSALSIRAGDSESVVPLVETNLGATGDDPRVRHVRSLVAVAADASERALAAAE